MRWARPVAQMGKMRNVSKIKLGKSKGIRSFGRSRHRWNLKDIVCMFTDFNWIRVVSSGKLL
jgi:hypothetical protein